MDRAKNRTQTFVSQTFGAPPGYPGKNPGCPAKKFGFPGFRGTYRTFSPPPLHVEEPHSTRRYPGQKVWVWVPFSNMRWNVIRSWGSGPSREKAIFKEKPSKEAIFPLSHGKDRMSQGVGNRGSLSSVPLALREGKDSLPSLFPVLNETSSDERRQRLIT